MTRPFIVVEHDGTYHEFPTSHAFLAWYLVAGNPDRMARTVRPDAPLYADLDALPVLTLPRRSDAAMSVTSPDSSRVEVADFGVPGSTDSGRSSGGRSHAGTAAPGTPPSEGEK